jgi:fructokinase
MDTYQIYGVGNALVDLEFRVTDAVLDMLDVKKGVMTLADEDQQQFLLNRLGVQPDQQMCGGSAANTIVAAQYFGAKCYYTCRVANDALGDFYLADLAKAGVDSRHPVSDMPGRTGTCIVLVTPDAERTLHTHLGITVSLNVGDINQQALAKSEWVYLEGYLSASPAGKEAACLAHQLARTAHAKVALTFSDPNMVQYCRQGLQDMLGDGVDLLFCNEKEAQLWANDTDSIASLHALRQVAHSIVMTRGAKGAVIWHQDQIMEIEPTMVKAVDTNGAGDMFAGAFLYALTHGFSWQNAGRFASRAAALLVTQMGPRLSSQQHQSLLLECEDFA